jgi:hypothetical protein
MRASRSWIPQQLPMLGVLLLHLRASRLATHHPLLRQPLQGLIQTPRPTQPHEHTAAARDIFPLFTSISTIRISRHRPRCISSGFSSSAFFCHPFVFVIRGRLLTCIYICVPFSANPPSSSPHSRSLTCSSTRPSWRLWCSRPPLDVRIDFPMLFLHPLLPRSHSLPGPLDLLGQPWREHRGETKQWGEKRYSNASRLTNSTYCPHLQAIPTRATHPRTGGPTRPSLSATHLRLSRSPSSWVATRTMFTCTLEWRLDGIYESSLAEAWFG